MSQPPQPPIIKPVPMMAATVTCSQSQYPQHYHQQEEHIQQYQQQEEQLQQYQQLEPFPFVPDPPRPKRVRQQDQDLNLRPTKFVPCEARESDYESDYDTLRFRPKWTPAGSDVEDPRYRMVHPPPPTSKSSAKRDARRTPTPPTVFDQPPTFEGPPRPIISPADIVKIKESLELGIKHSKNLKHKYWQYPTMACSLRLRYD